ncbi:MAG: hypothetical protein IT317_23845 [Anaerolineales bacterium]|nr:hypothetical protein [Anaerolineales bacterium]
MSRLQRVMQRVQSRGHDYGPLRAAAGKAAALALARQTPIGMFNKNVLRAKVVQGVVAALAGTGFYEMGTYHAATTIGAQRFLQVPVWSCEVNPRNYCISRLVTLGLPQITLIHADSRAFLRRVCAELKAVPGARPCFYLDAHENELDLATLPLAEELPLIFALDEFAVLVDDFGVPEQAGYRAGTFGGVTVEVDLIRPLLLDQGIRTCYFPAYPAAEDTGYPSGFCLFWRSARLDAAMRERAFPLDLIHPYSVERRAYVERASVAK